MQSDQALGRRWAVRELSRLSATLRCAAGARARSSRRTLARLSAGGGSGLQRPVAARLEAG